MSLDFIQIIYDDIQTQHCYPFARIHKNEKVTPYFENDVIKNIATTIGSDRIGICSWRLAQKRGDMFQLINKPALTKERIIEQRYDVAVLTPRSPNHKALFSARQWHAPNWDVAFGLFKSILKKEIGIRVPDELTNAIYENHFIANREIYHDYVRNCLTPTIDFIDKHIADNGEESIFLSDAGYAKRKTMQERQNYFESTGRRDWPIAPFLLERLFSIYCEGKGFKIIPL